MVTASHASMPFTIRGITCLELLCSSDWFWYVFNGKDDKATMACNLFTILDKLVKSGSMSLFVEGTEKIPVLFDL